MAIADNEKTITQPEQNASKEVNRAQILPGTQKRKYPRIKIFSLVSYAWVDNDGEILSQNYGKALEISQDGLLLETTSVVNADYVLLKIVDLENKIQELKGKVVYCKKTDP